MNNKDITKTICGAALLVPVSCLQDETMDDGFRSAGKYPSQIASVTGNADVAAESWGAGAPQIRVPENADGKN